MKNTKIFLDDERDPIFVKNIFPQEDSNWVVLRNYWEFQDYINRNLENVRLISFDHDISSFEEGGVEKTGKDAAHFLVEKCMERGVELPNFYVHSQNPVGRSNIVSYLVNFLNKVENKSLRLSPNVFGYVNQNLIFQNV